MGKVNRIEHLKSIKKDIRMLYNIGYVRAHIFRDMEILEDYFKLVEAEYDAMEIWDILHKKHKVSASQIRTIVRKMTIDY